MRFLFYLVICCLAGIITSGQTFGQDKTGKSVSFHIYSAHTSFPDTGRAMGHVYDKVLYTATAHYNDSTVLIVTPPKLDASKTVDLIFWFHGWGNNVDSAALRYQLIKQFIASKRNAVLVLPETARNSPDSYGGKLENAGMFKLLLGDVLQGLKSKKLIGQNCAYGNVILGGHSGAYRVIARIIKNGQIPISEVMLFDALYGETPVFVDWLKADAAHRFVHFTTDHGYGPKEETEVMMKMLAAQKIAFVTIEELSLKAAALSRDPIIFIHSLKEHNDIVDPDNFRLALQNEPFLRVLP